MDKEALKICSLYFITVIGLILIFGGIVVLITSSIDDDKPDDTWSDFADKSNQYTDYTLEKYKGYSPGIYASATCARITYTSGDTFVVNVEKEPSYTKWYHLYADDKGIRIEYHVTDYSSAVSYVDKVPSIYYIPYESIMSVYVNTAY